uniref:Uncharacterized protein n=1 Tax=Anopheles farauti TaxID=69004 RepID=A0A182QIU8_9DIPT
MDSILEVKGSNSKHKRMSLQVSNQTTSGRRTPQVYQGFGGVVGGGAAATTPSATNGSGAPNANSGSVGRPAKGGNKQSQIPVAIGSGVANATGNNGPTTPVIPQTAVVYPGTGGSIDGQKQQSSQLDHVYGMMMKQSPAAVQPTAGSARTQPTNGSQPAAAAANVAGEKNGPQQKKNAAAAKEGGTDGGPAAKKLEAQQQATTVPVEVTAKVRDSPRSRAQQKTEESVTSPKGAEKAIENSLLYEKPLKGFGPEGEEMESLLLEPFDLEEQLPTPQGGRSTAGTKSQKTAQKTTPQAQVSPFKAGGIKSEPDQSPSSKAKAQEGAGTNRSPKATEAAPPATPTAGDSVIGRPLRSISGRRSTRPISDIKFTHHRRSTDQHNDSFSSLNVTVGSEVDNNDSLLRTPLSASRKRKDMTPESTSGGLADGGAVDSPKRARFSGFFDLVSTPVTMLKNRLSRVMLQSTPCMLDVEEDEDTSKVVTAEATTTTTNVTPQKDESADKAATEAASMEVDKPEKPAGDVAKDAGDQQESASTAVADDEVEVKIVTEGEQQRKEWCSIM